MLATRPSQPPRATTAPRATTTPRVTTAPRVTIAPRATTTPRPNTASLYRAAPVRKRYDTARPHCLRRHSSPEAAQC